MLVQALADPAPVLPLRGSRGQGAASRRGEKTHTSGEQAEERKTTHEEHTFYDRSSRFHWTGDL